VVQVKVEFIIKNRDEEVKKIDEENKKAWQVAVDDELKKKFDELFIPLTDKGKVRKGSLKDPKRFSFKMGPKDLRYKTETGKSRKVPQTPIFKKDDLKKSFK